MFYKRLPLHLKIRHGDFRHRQEKKEGVMAELGEEGKNFSFLFDLIKAPLLDGL